MPDYGNDIYEPQNGVVLEPIRPPMEEPVYYDEEEYVFQDYNDIPLTPPTPQPTQRQVSGIISLVLKTITCTSSLLTPQKII